MLVSRELLFVFKMLLPVGSLFMHVHAHGTFSVLYPHPPSRSGSIGSILPEPSLPRNLRSFLSQFQASNVRLALFSLTLSPPGPGKTSRLDWRPKGRLLRPWGFSLPNPGTGRYPLLTCPAWGVIPPCPLLGRSPPYLALARGGIPRPYPHGEASPRLPLPRGGIPPPRCPTPQREHKLPTHNRFSTSQVY